METKIILIIDDSPISRKKSRHWLEHAAYTVVEAEDGASALSVLTRTRPDLIIQDLVLPDIEGGQLLLTIKQVSPNIPILAFSAVSDLSEQAGWIAAGFDGFLSKPGTAEVFLREIALRLTPPQPSRTVNNGTRILIAGSRQSKDDLRWLEARGYEVELASDLISTLRSAYHSRPDILVSGLVLTDTDGIQYYSAVRSDPNFDCVPFVFVTDFDLEPPLCESILSLGVDAIVSNIRTNEFLKTVTDMCRGQRRPIVSLPNTETLEPIRLQMLHHLVNRLGHTVQTLEHAKVFSDAKLAAMRRITDSLSLPGINPDEKIGNIFSTCLDACSIHQGALLTFEPEGRLLVRHTHGLSVSYLEAHQPGLTEKVNLCIKNDAIESFILEPQSKSGRRATGLMIPLIHGAPIRGAVLLACNEKTEMSSMILTFFRSVVGIFSQALSLKTAISRASVFEQRVSVLMENASDAIGVLDADGRFVDGNQHWSDITGVSRTNFMGRHFSEFMPISERDSQIQAFRTLSKSRQMHLNGIKLVHQVSGRLTVVDLSLSLLKTDGQNLVLAIARDVTERMELEQRLRHSQRLDAVGQLAGGVAHDFNNLMTIILASCHFLEKNLNANDARRDDVKAIRSAGERAADLTRHLLAFSRNQVMNPKSVNMNQVIAKMEPLIRRVLPENIELRLDLDEALSCVKADTGQIEQVLLNLMINARDAMPKGGTITLRTRNGEPPRGSSPKFARPHTCLVVEDTGSGMDAVTLNRIFEPFYTTKGAGKGTGLGLSTVYGIVKQSDGEMRVESTPGNGALFFVYLPVDESGEWQNADPRPEMAIEPPALHKEKLLLVEDEESLRLMLARILREAGYKVLEAESGEACLRILGEQGCEIDGVLSDVVMPGMNGYSLGQRISELYPHVRCLFMTGYANEARHSSRFEGLTLQKPMEPSVLLQRVEDLFPIVG